MDVQIRDAAALRRVSPVMVRAYLEARGWQHVETWRNRIMDMVTTSGEQVSEALIRCVSNPTPMLYESRSISPSV